MEPENAAAAIFACCCVRDRRPSYPIRGALSLILRTVGERRGSSLVARPRRSVALRAVARNLCAARGVSSLILTGFPPALARHTAPRTGRGNRTFGHSPGNFDPAVTSIAVSPPVGITVRPNQTKRAVGCDRSRS